MESWRVCEIEDGSWCAGCPIAHVDRLRGTIQGTEANTERQVVRREEDQMLFD